MASKMSAEGRANENSAKDKKYISVAEFYHGRSIFITGGTGFMGKVGLVPLHIIHAERNYSKKLVLCNYRFSLKSCCVLVLE